MRRLRPLEDITVVLREQRPAAFFFRRARYEVERAYGPWLLSGEWWSETQWRMQQWDIVARTNDGSLLFCCLVGNLAQDRWHMAGLYD